MNARGHNERSFRLDSLAADAREGLAKVEQGEEFTIAGWLAYGLALNEGRALFQGDKEFGEWVSLHQLGTAASGEEIRREDRAAAMWASANADQFEEARQRGNPRTIRGIHAKWKEIEAERAEEDRQRAEARSKADQENGAPSDPQENKGDAAREVGKNDAIGAAQSTPDQEQPLTHAEAEADAEAFEDGTDGGGDHSPAPVQEPEPTPDPYGYGKLTEEALLDLANGLRADLNDEKIAHAETKAKLKEVNEKLKNRTADDKDEVIRRLEAKAKNAGDAKWKALEDRDAYHRQVNALKKRVAELENVGMAY